MTEAEAMIWTYAIELPVTLLAGWLWRCRWQRGLVSGLLASGLTHPLAWTLAQAWPAETFLQGFFIIEAGVVLVETVVLRFGMRLGWGQAFCLSLLANGLSAGAGWVLT